jgi:hypothetical protein
MEVDPDRDIVKRKRRAVRVRAMDFFHRHNFISPSVDEDNHSLLGPGAEVSAKLEHPIHNERTVEYPAHFAIVFEDSDFNCRFL